MGKPVSDTPSYGWRFVTFMIIRHLAFYAVYCLILPRSYKKLLRVTMLDLHE